MTMTTALSRSRPLMKQQREIGLAMTKLWGKKRPAEAEITMHLSPHEQHVIVPWLKTFPKKIVDRAPYYLWPIGTFAFVYAVVEGSNAWDRAEDFGHRS